MFKFIVESPGMRLDLFLALHTGKSRAYIQEQINAGSVFINEKAATKSSQKLKTNDSLTGKFEAVPEPTHLIATPGKLDIIFDDSDLLVINKPAGLVVHPGAGHPSDTLVNYLLHYLTNPSFAELSEIRPGIVHRLDQGTSGLIIIAKKREIQEALSEQFKKRLIKKTYEALAWGTLPLSGIFESSIGRDKRDRKKISSNTSHGKHAKTLFETLTRYQHFTHVRLNPETGRTHQLRVHLSEGGNPIVGDPTYSRGNHPKRLSQLHPDLSAALSTLSHTLLHAKRLKFKHPQTNKELDFTAPRDTHFDEILCKLEKFDKK